MPLHLDVSPAHPPDAACAVGKPCPISAQPCPGECIYAAILASISLGVIVFDLERSAVAFCNQWARATFARVDVPVEYGRLAALLLAAGNRPAGTVVQPEPIRFGQRLLGFSVYYGRGVAWVFLRDITEKARLEAIAAAVETTNNIGYVFSAVRHEIGNPINSVKVALGVLAANLDRFSRDDIAEYVQRMSTEIARIERLLRALRSFSAYERPEIESVELGAFFDDFLALVRRETEARGIRLSTHITRGATLLCDPRALHHVLLNLVTNACDALAGRASPCLDLRSEAQGAVMTIRVEDNGAGMSAEQQARLFQPFSTTKPSGTGLGLVIAKKLLASMNGTISIESRDGWGTTAIVSLPTGDSPLSTRLDARLP